MRYCNLNEINECIAFYSSYTQRINARPVLYMYHIVYHISVVTHVFIYLFIHDEMKHTLMRIR